MSAADSFQRRIAEIYGGSIEAPPRYMIPGPDGAVELDLTFLPSHHDIDHLTEHSKGYPECRFYAEGFNINGSKEAAYYVQDGTSATYTPEFNPPAQALVFFNMANLESVPGCTVKTIVAKNLVSLEDAEPKGPGGAGPVSAYVSPQGRGVGGARGVSLAVGDRVAVDSGRDL